MEVQKKKNKDCAMKSIRFFLIVGGLITLVHQESTASYFSQPKEKEKPFNFDLPDEETRLPHTASCCFDDPDVRRTFSALLSTGSSLGEVYALQNDHTAENFYQFFLAYVDIPPLERLYIRRGSKFELNEPRLTIPREDIPLANMNWRKKAKHTWKNYKKAGCLAGKFHVLEAYNLIIDNHELFKPEMLSSHSLERVQDTARRSQEYFRALSGLHTLIYEQTLAYLSGYNTTFGTPRVIAQRLKTFSAYFDTIKSKEFRMAKTDLQISQYLLLKDAAESLSEACRNDAKNETLSTVLNLLNGYTKKPQGPTQKEAKEPGYIRLVSTLIHPSQINTFGKARAAIAGFMDQKEDIVGSSRIIEATEAFFKYYPGIPMPAYFLHFYTMLFNAATNTHDQRLKHQLYRLSNSCARKLFYLVGDDATSNQLFDAFMRFRFAAFSCEKGQEELSKAACYYFMRGENALAFEAALLENIADIDDQAHKHEAKAETSKEDGTYLYPLKLRDLYYKTAIDLARRKIYLPSKEEDLLYVSRLYYKRAHNEDDREKKQAHYEEALKVIADRVAKYEAEEEAEGEYFQKKVAARLYQQAAGLNYLCALKVVTPKAQEPEIKLADLEDFVFDHTGTKGFKGGVPSSTTIKVQALFTKRTQQEFLHKAARCVIKMIDILGDEGLLGHINFGLEVTDVALQVLKKEDPLFQTCLRLRLVYLAHRMKGLGKLAQEDDYEEAYRILRQCAYEINDQAKIGKAYESALAYQILAIGKPCIPNKLIACADELLTWASRPTSGYPFPSRLKAPFYERAAAHVQAALRVFKNTVSPKEWEGLFKRFTRALKDPEIKKPSFRLGYIITDSLYKAALKSDDALMGRLLIKATESLEELLLLLPKDIWPSADHYHLLEVSYQKLALLQDANRERKELFEEKTATYKQYTKELKAAKKKMRSFKSLFPYSRFQVTSKHKELTEFYAFLEETLTSLNRVTIKIERATLDQESSEEIPEELVEKMSTILESVAPKENRMRFPSFKEKSSQTVLPDAYELLYSPEKRSAQLRKVLQYVSAVPKEKRLFLRNGPRLSLQVSPHVDNSAHTSWNEQLKLLMPLVFVRDPLACLLLSQSEREQQLLHAEHNMVYDLTTEFLRGEFPLTQEEALEICQLLHLGQITPVLESLKKKLRGQFRTILEKITKRHSSSPLVQEVPDIGKLEQLATLSRETAESMKNASQKAEYLLSSANYWNDIGTLIEKTRFPTREEFERIYHAYKAAQESGGLSKSAMLLAAQQAADAASKLVDYLGDDATKEDYKTAYDENMLLLKLYEKSIASLMGTKYEDERRKARKNMLKAFETAQHYFDAYARLLYPQKTVANVKEIADTLKNKVEDASITEELQMLDRSSESSPRSPRQSSAQNCCRLFQAVTYYEKWLALLGNNVNQKQLEQVTEICQKGQEYAKSAHFPVLAARFLASSLEIQKVLKAHSTAMATANKKLLAICLALHTCTNKENSPANCYTITELQFSKARTCLDPEEKYEELVAACEQGLSLINLSKKDAEGPSNGMIQLTIQGQELKKSLTWIQGHLTTILLETAKHAPSDKEALVWIEKGLEELAIEIPAHIDSQALPVSTWLAVAAALLKSKTQKFQPSSQFGSPYASNFSSPASSLRATPLPSPQRSPRSLNPSPRRSPRSPDISPREAQLPPNRRGHRRTKSYDPNKSVGKTNLSRLALTKSSQGLSKEGPKRAREERIITVLSPRGTSKNNTTSQPLSNFNIKGLKTLDDFLAAASKKDNNKGKQEEDQGK